MAEKLPVSLTNGQLERLQTGDALAIYDGSASNPALCFVADTNTGIYRSGTDNVALATGGVTALSITSNQFVVIGGVANSGQLTTIRNNGLIFQRLDIDGGTVNIICQNLSAANTIKSCGFRFDLANNVSSTAITSLQFQSAALNTWTSDTSTHTSSFSVAIRDRGTLSVRFIVTGYGTVRLTDAAPVDALIEGELLHNSTQKALQIKSAGIDRFLIGSIFTSTADQSVANTTSEGTLIGTGVGTLTLPANFWTVGKTIRLRIWGYYSNDVIPGDTNIRVKIGSVTVMSTGDKLLNNAAETDRAFSMEFDLTCRTTGASGTILGNGRFQYVRDNALPEYLPLSGLETVNTTAAATLDVTAQWTAAEIGNHLTSTQVSVEVLS